MDIKELAKLNFSMFYIRKGHKMIYNIKNNKNVIQFTSRFNTMPDYIKKIIADLKNAQNREQMYDILDSAVEKTSDFNCYDDTCFVGSGYKFQCTLKQYVQKYDLAKMSKETGMDFVDIIPIGKSDRCVVVLKAKNSAK